MSEEDKWLVAFGRGWIDLSEIEDSGHTLFSLYVILARAGELDRDVPMDRVRLKVKE